MSDKHLSSQFDADLEKISTRLMSLGGLVEQQISLAIQALGQLDGSLADQVLTIETQVNETEVEMDRDIASIIGRRQPTARDLRLLMAVSKTTANLERMGDETTKVARMVQAIVNTSSPRSLPTAELRLTADLAQNQVRKVLTAFARLDVPTAVGILREDHDIDRAFEGFVRQLITYMMEDPRTISASLDLLFVAKALERIGDHAKNIAELIIYIVRGDDVRHTPLDEVEQSLR